MDAYEAILTKRHTRDYEAREIPEDVISRILQAGRMAGSSENEQPIRVIVVRDVAQKTALANCGDGTKHLPTSPLVIVLVRIDGSLPFDAGRVGQNMMVAAQSWGITSCPVDVFKRHDDVRKVLGLPPDQIVAMTLTFGYPMGGYATSRGEPRLAFEDYVHWERWGQSRDYDDSF